MSEKIGTYYYNELDIDSSVRGRFGSTFKNIEEIKEYPLVGRGLLFQTRFDEDAGMLIILTRWHLDLTEKLVGTVAYLYKRICILLRQKNIFGSD